ncbi:MAG: hypothetical protein IJ225_10785 [Solobacterium sp.]|nr:hypothetical protein [Solobacterium sp.]
MNSKAIIKTGIALAAIAMTPSAVYLTLSRPQKEKKKKPGTKTIICIGDSITFGAGVLTSRKKDAWPYLLDRMMGQEAEVLNYGISGATMLRSGDTPYREDFYRAVEEIDPQTILLMLGTNDSKRQNWNAELFAKDYEDFLKRFMKEGRKIILMYPPKAFGKKGKEVSVYGIRDHEIHEGVIPVIHTMADQYNLQVIDLYALSENHPEYLGDGVHPNKQGNAIIADHIFKIIGSRAA